MVHPTDPRPPSGLPLPAVLQAGQAVRPYVVAGLLAAGARTPA